MPPRGVRRAACGVRHANARSVSFGRSTSRTRSSPHSPVSGQALCAAAAASASAAAGAPLTLPPTLHCSLARPAASSRQEFTFKRVFSAPCFLAWRVRASGKLLHSTPLLRESIHLLGWCKLSRSSQHPTNAKQTQQTSAVASAS